MTAEVSGGAPAGGPAPPAPVHASPAWRREPYRLLFPTGLLLAWAGVGHWLLHGLGLMPHYRPVFHSIVQIQGFMMCFAVGFLFTAIPRRTGTPPPAAWQMLIALVAPLGTTIAAWYQRWAISQACWLALVLVLLGFAMARFRSARAERRPPNSFVWVPTSFGIGIAGSALTGAYSLSPDYSWLHDLGRLLLLQGMFAGLVVGVGGLVFPLITRGEAPPDGRATRRDRWIRTVHLAAAAALVGTFWIEISVSARWALGLRAALLACLLGLGARLWRLPSEPGWHRLLVWLSGWMIPAGYALAALFPLQKKAGLHVVFVGGFALMALSVGLHVGLAHGGYRELVRGRPWQVPAYGSLLLLSMVARGLVDFDPRRFFAWLAASAALLLLATLVWGALLLPRLVREAGNDPGRGLPPTPAG